jgi:hypothetical protein
MADSETNHDGAVPVKASMLMATCSICGDVLIPVRDTLTRRGGGSVPGWYAFGCPSCGRRVKVEADPHLLAVLNCLGAIEDLIDAEALAGLTAASAPAAAPTAARVVAGPLTIQEVLDLTIDLHAIDDLVALALSAGPRP